MEFGWINAAGGMIVILMLIPNVVYALRCPGGGSGSGSRSMNMLEQIGRYASMALMIFPIGVWKFGFPSVAAMLVYVFGNAGLLVCYWVYWALYFRRADRDRALMLAVAPVCIFLLSGLTLRHWLLVLAAAVFGVGHVYVTRRNHTDVP